MFVQPAFLDVGHTQVLTLGVAPGNQQGQVVVTLGVHRQKADGVGAVGVIGIHHPQVHAENRLYAGAKGCLVYLYQAVEIGHIGDGHGGMPSSATRWTRGPVGPGHRPGSILYGGEGERTDSSGEYPTLVRFSGAAFLEYFI